MTCAPSSRAQLSVVRIYDPTTGTFLTRDPLEAATRSTYGYVQGDPLNNTDPAGMMGWHCDTSGIGVNAGKSCAQQTKEHNQQQAASEQGGLCFNNPFKHDGCVSLADSSPIARKIRSGAVVVLGGALFVAGVGGIYAVWGLGGLAWATLGAFASPYAGELYAFGMVAWTGNWGCNAKATKIISGATNVPRPSRDPTAGPGGDEGVP